MRAQRWSNGGSTICIHLILSRAPVAQRHEGGGAVLLNAPWRTAMEVGERYYSMAPNSCVLTLYVGHVRSLRSSLEAVESGQAFAERLG